MPFAIIDERERAKIVKLYVDHNLSLARLRERLLRGRQVLERVLDEAGVVRSRNRNRTRGYQEAP